MTLVVIHLLGTQISTPPHTIIEAETQIQMEGWMGKKL